MNLSTALKTIFPAIVIMVLLNHEPAHAWQTAAPGVTGLKTGYYVNPIGIGHENPHLSWIVTGTRQNISQSAWQVQVALGPEQLEAGDLVWDSRKVPSDQSVYNRYGGPSLEPRTRYYWRVRVWDDQEDVSRWSDIAFWETGLFDIWEWKAEWIEPDLDEDTDVSQPAPMLRYEFETTGRIKSARAYITSNGLYELNINGRKTGDELFTPGWTSYHNRLQYQAYDITGYLREGRNAIGVFLGDGWFRGYIGWGDQRNYYGDRLALLAQIEITYEDGRKQVVGTGEGWKSSTGPILRSDIYNGEYYDARLEKPGWDIPGYDDGNWSGVRLASYSKSRLIEQQAPPVKIIQELTPVDIFRTPEGLLVADMGQNMVGWVKMRVNGPRGTVITIRHAEVLDRDGNFYTDNLRSADQVNTYVLKGSGIETFEPRFSFQGFRYVAIEGFPGELTPDNIRGMVIHSEMEPTGHFQSSHPLINHLQHNIVWGQKGNFLDVPTDCPQRDERMGWTGDIQVFANTANTNMYTAGFLAKWLGDLAADQNEAGSVPHVVPNVLGAGSYGSAGWGDAALIVPWSVYMYFGDKEILEKQYESMKAWVEFIRARAAGNENSFLWDVDFSFGDWLSYSTASDAHYPGAYTDFRMIATMFFAHSTDILRRTATLLGHQEDAEVYGNLLEDIKQAFRQEYVTPSMRVMSDTQTAYLLTLAFDLVPDDQKPAVVDHLVRAVRSRGHLTTGFLGTPWLNPILSRYGHTPVAYELMLRERFPSWLYPVRMGATTIWERWDGIKPDGSFQDEGMNSFNHYAYGAIGEWLYQVVAGIKPLTPGYKTFAIHPVPGGGLDHARAIINSVYGRIESSWVIEGERFTLNVEIPANTKAFVTLPLARLEEVSGSNRERDLNPGLLNMVSEGENVLVHLGSGKYTFSWISPELVETAGIARHDHTPAWREEYTVGEMLAVRNTREILYRYLPDLTNSPWLSQVMGFTLRQAMQALPAHYRVPGSTLEKIRQEINQAGMGD